MTIPVITISNRDPDPIREPYYHLPAFKESCRRQGITPIFLPGVYKGLMSKPRLLLDYLHKEGSKFDRLIFSDAWDVVFLCGVQEILYNFNGFGAPIVFNAERGCFPRPDLAPKFDQFKWVRNSDGPQTLELLPYRFLNSGFFVGETAATISMLETMRDKWGFPDDIRGTFAPNDQEFYQLWYLENQDKARLDYHGILCQSLHESEPNEFAYLPDTERVISLLTKNQPCCVHGNGNGKKWLARIIKWLNL